MDVRFYDTAFYTSSEVQLLAFNWRSESYINPHWDADTDSHVHKHKDEEGNSNIYLVSEVISSLYIYPGSNVYPDPIGGPNSESDFFAFFESSSRILNSCHAS